MSALLSASLVHMSIRSLWALAAISGTTPLKSECRLFWFKTIEDKISIFLLSVQFVIFTTEAAVSSQLLSTPKTWYDSSFDFFFHKGVLVSSLYSRYPCIYGH